MAVVEEDKNIEFLIYVLPGLVFFRGSADRLVLRPKECS